MDATGPNADQISYWNQAAGPRWVALQEILDEQICGLGEVAMDRLGIVPGEHVVDVGCGTGQSTLELARRAGPAGRVVGMDISQPMLTRARARATSAGATNVTFVAADVQTHAFEPERADACFSRFGVMFFADPIAAFANLRAALRPGGRLGFVCWQALPDNPWMLVPLSAAVQHVPLPAIASPDAPGPFAFADPARVQGILERAGFSAVTIVDHRRVLTVGGTRGLDRAVEFMMQMGPTAAALREADPGLRATVAAAIREAIAPYDTPSGVRMSSAAWLITAERD
jgi:SAM-dependent methyltransferase